MRTAPSVFVPDQLGGLQQPPDADQARRQPPFGGSRDVESAFRQCSDIGADGGAGVHVGVHRGRGEYGRGGRQDGGGHRVVRETERQLRQRVGGGGYYRHKVDALRDGDVVDGQLRIRLEKAGHDRAMGYRAKSERRDEALGGVGHQDVDVRAQPNKPACEIDGFVAGDGAGDA